MRRALAIGVLLLGACSDPFAWERLEPGQFSGRVQLEWVAPDLFLFEPAADRPLRFTRKRGETIAPGRMLTDGGSIPRPLWAFRSYSPWGYGPAFIVHDWLFVAHHCGLPPPYTLEDAALVMGEAIRTLVEKAGGPQADEVPVVRSMLVAVTSPIAREIWETGRCPSPDEIDNALDRFAGKRAPPGPARSRITIDFDAPCPSVGADLVNPLCPRRARP